MNYKLHTKYKKILADLYTPVGLYNKLRDQFSNALLLESADYHDRTDSKSFICLEPIAGFEAKGNAYSYNFPNEEIRNETLEQPKEIFSSFQSFVSKFENTQTDLPFNTQGVWGFSSFESVQYMEDIKLPVSNNELKDNPDLKYQFFRYILVFDHFKNELFITQNEVNTPIESMENIENIIRILQINNLPNFTFKSIEEETSNVSDKKYKEMVSTGINHCKIGDTFQVVLSREFQQKYKGDDFNLYRCLRSINPSPYLFYFDYGDFKIFGSSPESQLQVANHVASINPIAGTVLRSDNPENDTKLAEELKQNPKEMSEHVMLVDLARNDLSKNSEKVEIENYAEIQYFSHVIHMVSKVKGNLLKDRSGLDIYADTFPAGTLSGAPKYRALEIIAENENVPRNFYGGAIGFIGFDGSVNHAIIIRSLLSKNNTLVYQAGAGIVADSTPEGELQEVNNKIAAIRAAIQKANEI
ncbi:anthranilate synthase component I family protein [Putridiphycobacter roseus]|uniref:Anthranilate synthase component 1 n=1 Tax=Putridiphycobacter roseus TaxID=2219161 RepID=A0A2W1MWX0_9FLAO|nr:anthranilate synthase component I family protein [Putridiphycobacter roseus]PZE15650.1 anthranilate synthase component I family protein [Putridiphycobacter roseus]